MRIMPKLTGRLPGAVIAMLGIGPGERVVAWGSSPGADATQTMFAAATDKAMLEATKSDNSWGNQIRSYVFQPYTMVNDHRTELKLSDVHEVMDGDLDELIEAFLKRNGESAA